MAAPASGSLQALLVQAGSRVCALPLASIVETLRPLPAEKLPNVPAFVQGLATIRGLPVPVVDLGLLMSQDSVVPCQRFVLLRLGERRLAVAVQSVFGLRCLDLSDVVALPPLLRDARPEALEAVGVLDRQLLMVLEAGRLLPDEVWQQMQSDRPVT